MEDKNKIDEQQEKKESQNVRNSLIEGMNAVREMGVNPYPPHVYENTVKLGEILKTEGVTSDGPTEEKFRISGRVVSKRGMGKSVFGHIEDLTGKVQFYVKKNEIEEKDFELFKKVKVGDFLGFEGPLFVTRTGEMTLLVKSLTLLSKAIRPMPEKWHGLKDVEIRSRKRYLDLMVNHDVREKFINRSKIITAMRNRLGELGFLEVETPILQPIYGGASARPFTTHHNSLHMDLFLRIAPELYLKRLLVGGLERVFEIGRVFRNEGISAQHNPEFTMLELYQAYGDFETMMDISEELISKGRESITDSEEIQFGDHNISYKRPFKRISMVDAVMEVTGLNEETVKDTAVLKDLLSKKKVDFEGIESFGELVNMVFEEYVEETLINPTFIYNYPVEVSPLAKKHRCPDMDGFVERFELFIAGKEIANAFSELNDPLDQRERFEGQLQMVDKKGENIREIDEDYLEAMEHGMPPAGGLGIGIDRLVMMLTGETTIREIILFPLHKSV